MSDNLDIPEKLSIREPRMPTHRSLWTRYLLPVGLMRAPQGDLFLHRAMRVDNLETLRRWMPHYVKVHGVLAGLLTVAMCAAVGLGLPFWLNLLGALANASELLLFIVFTGLALALRLPVPPSGWH